MPTLKRREANLMSETKEEKCQEEKVSDSL
jgi:hypothetical protein